MNNERKRFGKKEEKISSETEIKKVVPSAISLDEALKKNPQTFGRKKKKEVDTQKLKEVLEESLKVTETKKEEDE